MPAVLSPGEIDADGDVDFTDFTILSGKVAGTLQPRDGDKTQDQGDFEGDGDLDLADFSVLSGNFAGTAMTPASAAGSQIATSNPDEIELLSI